MKSRSSTPGVIAVTGIVVVAVCGVFVSKYSTSKPILRLKPELEKHFGVRGFHCALKINEHRIEITPPVELPQDRAFRRQIASYSLLRYFELTDGKTVIDTATVVSPKGATLPPEDVDAPSANASRVAAVEATELLRPIAGVATASVSGAGAAAQGSALWLKPPVGSTLSESEARDLGQLVLRRVANVSFVHVDRGDGGAYEGGADTAALGSGTRPAGGERGLKETAGSGR